MYMQVSESKKMISVLNIYKDKYYKFGEEVKSVLKN